MTKKYFVSLTNVLEMQHHAKLCSQIAREHFEKGNYRRATYWQKESAFGYEVSRNWRNEYVCST